MGKMLLIAFSLLVSQATNAQYYDGRIRIDSLNKSYIFQVMEGNRRTALKDFYYWFKSGHIHKTQGSYYGKLLHGNYKVIDNDRHLLEEGFFKKGKKVGLWRSWYENGTLKSTWRKHFGFWNKAYALKEFDVHGNSIKSGLENKGLYCGNQVENSGDSSMVKHYKKGIVLPNQ